jgi:hypothetical protein
LFKLSQIMVLTIRKFIITSQMSIIDNGSNYKKACPYLTNEYQHIAWQPCLAHTINLILKTIGNFPDHESVIDSAKLIARWLYNHGKLHTMMKNAIGGNLVR